MHSTYDYWMVALSIVLATVASFAVFDLVSRIRSAQGSARVLWLAFAAASMGLGIWAMHYVGMLAFSLPIPVFYHVPTVALSLLVAIATSAIALFVVSRPQMALWQEFAGGAMMGGGIAAMHYIGMAAMRCSCVITYNPWLVALSMIVAVSVSAAAVRLTFRFRNDDLLSQARVIGALALGSAIPLMHYTGMWAATFRDSPLAPNLRNTMSVSSVGTVAIGVSALGVLLGAIASSFFDRFMVLQRSFLDAARERESYFHTMAEAVPEMIWTADPEGRYDYFNHRAFDYMGMTADQLKGDGWVKAVHPEDVEHCLSKWKIALRTGEPYEVEYRLRRKDGAFRWFIGRAKPIRNSDGKIVKWFGTCTDIENQKQNQQLLEEQIDQRTEQLADLNARLQEEMMERDFARSALDQQHAAMMLELEERSKRATLLAKMGEHLQSCISRDEVFAAAVGFAPKIFPSARGAIAVLNAARSQAEVIGSWADCQLTANEFDLTACWALRTGHPHLVPVGDSTAPCAHAVGVSHTYLCVPILAQGEALGVLHLQATDAVPQLNAAELSLNTTFAGQVGLSIANIKLREALRIQSVRDVLTGLYNRRYLEEVLDREIRRAGRAAQSLGLVILDLDHFKTFNDTYGHDAGDTVLREAAALLVKNVRTEDFVCRYGGEEFVIILPTADLDGARARAERLRMKTKELTIVYQGQTLRMVTFSMGVAEFPRHGTTPQELMAAADAALYQAKREGRDRVVVAASPEPPPPPDLEKSAATSA
jgi:diguanylate cyclase (GGDEF)-like protein/PAS domain S-box-containing protein